MGISEKKAIKASRSFRLTFAGVEDPRRARGMRHSHEGMLRQAVAALTTGVHSLRAVEAFGEEIPVRGLRSLGLKRPVSDTCFYGLLSKQQTAGFAEELVSQVKEAIKEKIISNDLFGEGVVAIDGKAIWSGPCEALPEARKTKGADGLPTWFVMAQRACLVSSSARPVIHQRLIPSDAGEADSFAEVYQFLVANFGRSFGVVTYDAGGVSRANAKLVNESNRAYWFAIKGNQPSVHQKAMSLLGTHMDDGDGNRQGEAFTKDVSQGCDIVRESFGVSIDADDPCVEFSGARQLWRIRQTTTERSTGEFTVIDRYFITNKVFNAEKALHLARLHWGIENGPNWTMDMILGEDDGTVCTKGRAVEVWSWLRLLAYNVLSFWRRRLKPRHGKATSWEAASAFILAFFLTLTDSTTAPIV